MKNKYDDLGDRMKRYEVVSNFQKLIPGLPLYARIDGRHFHTFTKGFGFPYPELKEKCGFELSNAMIKTAEILCKEFNCSLVETHSDEISLGWTQMEKAPFDGEYFKLVSNIASYAGVVFFKNVLTYIPDKVMKGIFPSFDCRVFQVPDEMELANLFVWRQNDCMRGCLNQYAQQFFSHKELQGKSGKERYQMLIDAGHNYDEKVFSTFKYGYFCHREKYVKQYNAAEATPVVRTKVVRMVVDFPLSKLDNKVSFLFYDDHEPCLKKEQ